MKIIKTMAASAIALGLTATTSLGVVVVEFLPSPDGEEYMVIQNTTGTSVDLIDYTWTIGGGTTGSISGTSQTLDNNEYVIVSRQGVGAFIGSYPTVSLADAQHFITNSSLDMAAGESSVEITGPDSYSYEVEYNFDEGSPYDGSCIVDNSGAAPSVSSGISGSGITPVPEPSSLALGSLGLLSLCLRRRRVS